MTPLPLVLINPPPPPEAYRTFSVIPLILIDSRRTVPTVDLYLSSRRPDYLGNVITKGNIYIMLVYTV